MPTEFVLKGTPGKGGRKLRLRRARPGHALRPPMWFMKAQICGGPSPRPSVSPNSGERSVFSFSPLALREPLPQRPSPFEGTSCFPGGSSGSLTTSPWK